MSSYIWCGRAPYLVALSPSEVTDILERVRRDTDHEFVFFETENGQAALHLDHISSVSPVQTGPRR